MPLKNRFLSYSRFVKLEHSLFALPLIFSGAILAGNRWPSASLCALILGAGFGARTAAFALNRIIDRHIDARNPRTAERELPKGLMSLGEGWGVFGVGVLVYAACAWAIAPICFYASPIPLGLFVLYPYLKRFTPLAHFGVGAADAMAPLGGWVAVTQAFTPIWPGIWLALFTTFWVTGFDIIYSTMDEAFDRKEGLYSLPSRCGKAAALKISGVLHLLAFACLAVLWHFYLRTPLSLGVLLVIAGLLYWEHRHSANIDLAFFKMNAIIGFAVLALVLAA